MFSSSHQSIHYSYFENRFLDCSFAQSPHRSACRSLAMFRIAFIWVRACLIARFRREETHPHPSCPLRFAGARLSFAIDIRVLARTLRAHLADLVLQIEGAEEA